MDTNKKRLRPIMFVGTGSDVGKSIVNAAFCRIFKNDGYTPAPFKAQNMSLNSYPTSDGLEIGRAQAVQAEACGVECRVEMNPILLKPTSNQSSQVVLHGKPIGDQTAKEYFLGENKKHLFQEAMNSYHILEKEYNPMVIEGAGSISELNLKDRDIVNMRVAKHTQAATFLIADINRGGVFGSVYGTLQLLPPEERALIEGIVINKFRGDASLFDEGKRMLEDLTGVPVVSVIPYFQDIYIDDEDSVVLETKKGYIQKEKVNIVVIELRHLSNFTDFNQLERVDSINLFYSQNPNDIRQADIVILPGSKNTIGDLCFLKETELFDALIEVHKKNKPVYGVCGGYQMMGQTISDPFHVESDKNQVEGLGILPIKTVLTQEKTTQQRAFYFKNEKQICRGYEIHMGVSEALNPSTLITTLDGGIDGYFLNNRTWGTYMHGVFDNEVVINQLLKEVGADLIEMDSIQGFKDAQYNQLAAHVKQVTDMDKIYKILEA